MEEIYPEIGIEEGGRGLRGVGRGGRKEGKGSS
jgi:hypothetical protein